ncbi:DUF998 domain-containing protein [Nocardioides sp. NPDC092400]|uniref:DUF998 domain-containing protein n=1 Tax=Nocardioides sp. NPDC092400 TaxID=3155196 RepID=UPI003412639C
MPTARRRRLLRAASLPAAYWGALALLVRPAYIATEFVVAAATNGGYSFLADSVSRLGEVGCSAAYCSPRHEVMSWSSIGFGALLAGGAVLLRRALGPWVTGLLAISGLSSAATGLAPLDQDPALHALAAAPLFVAQPVALVVLGARLRHVRPRLSRAILATGVVAGMAAVAFVLSSDGPTSGALERLALWPVLVGLAAFACTLVSTDDRSGPGGVSAGTTPPRAADAAGGLSGEVAIQPQTPAG